MGRKVDPTPAAYPDATIALKGKYVTLQELTADEDYASLWCHLNLKEDGDLFDYLPFEAPQDEVSARGTVKAMAQRGFVTYAIKADPTSLNPPAKGDSSSHSEVVGIICYLSISTANRDIEVGGIIFSKLMQRSVAATEANYLMLRNAFESSSPGPGNKTLPYRRVVWKCNNLNKVSRRAAERLGYVYEGTFRNHIIVKGRNRDSDWLSVIEEEWPVVKAALEQWLKASNFDDQGRQIKSVDEIRAGLK